ncbi:hypothetical protein JZ751_014134 [Albula glossodonta]|uniref:Uncharacterized protein n=1 Tax=Albula glossodonta TaxID=121402 RepID=A0A8T2NVN0_9TELE|nr:hypothetical protein JZ751_014134 [Albula glossodonta]
MGLWEESWAQRRPDDADRGHLNRTERNMFSYHQFVVSEMRENFGTLRLFTEESERLLQCLLGCSEHSPSPHSGAGSVKGRSCQRACHGRGRHGTRNLLPMKEILCNPSEKEGQMGAAFQLKEFHSRQCLQTDMVKITFQQVAGQKPEKEKDGDKAEILIPCPHVSLLH